MYSYPIFHCYSACCRGFCVRNSNGRVGFWRKRRHGNGYCFWWHFTVHLFVVSLGGNIGYSFWSGCWHVYRNGNRRQRMYYDRFRYGIATQLA
jgi:hypothetical protein